MMIDLLPGAGGRGGNGTDEEGAGGGGDGSGGGGGGTGGGTGGGNEGGGGGTSPPTPAPLSFVGDTTLSLGASGTVSIAVPQVVATAGAAGLYDVVITLAIASISSPTSFYDVASQVVGTLSASGTLSPTMMGQTLDLQNLPSGPYVAELVLGDTQGDAYSTDVLSYLGAIPIGGTPVVLSDVPPPAAPLGLADSATTTNATLLSWQAATVADGGTVTGYTVYENGTAIASTKATELQIDGLSPGTGYVFTVAASDIAGSSAQSPPLGVVTAITTPTAPAGVQAQNIASHTLTLTWGASFVAGGTVTGYLVSENGITIASTTATSYSVGGLAANTTYGFAIVAQDTAGNSRPSAVVDATTAVAIPSTPSGLTLTGVAGGAATLSWQASGIAGGGATPHYVIYENGLAVARAAATVVTISGLTPATTYDFSVAAKDSTGLSDPSPSLSVTTGTVVTPGSNTLPSLSSFLSPLSEAAVLGVTLALDGSDPQINDVAIGSGTPTNPVMENALNAVSVTQALPASTTILPTGYRVGYALGGGPITLADTAGNDLLVAVASQTTLDGGSGDTLVGGEGDVTFATSGTTGSVIGGSGSNTIYLGAAVSDVMSQGTDTVIGSGGNATISAMETLLFLGASGNSEIDLEGAGTVIGGSGASTIFGGMGKQLIFGGGQLVYDGGGGAATIIGATGGNTVSGGTGNLLLFASASMTYDGGSGAATIVGGGSPLHAFLGTGGGIAYGSPGGNNVIASTGGTAILVGAGDGDLLTVSGTVNDTLVAGAGSETLAGAGSSGSLVLFGGSGADVEVGGQGNNLFVTAIGNETLVGGGSSNDYVFANAPGGPRTDVIAGFNPATDAIGLFGYGTEPGADDIANVAKSGTLLLSDGTQIVFTGAPTLSANNFF